MLLNIYINLAGCFFSNSHFLFVKFDYLLVAFHTFDVNIAVVIAQNCFVILGDLLESR